MIDLGSGSMVFFGDGNGHMKEYGFFCMASAMVLSVAVGERLSTDDVGDAAIGLVGFSSRSRLVSPAESPLRGSLGAVVIIVGGGAGRVATVVVCVVCLIWLGETPGVIFFMSSSCRGDEGVIVLFRRLAGAGAGTGVVVGTT